MGIERLFFGKTEEGQEVYIYSLTNSSGMRADISNYGGVVVSLSVPDKNGDFDDVVLGYDKFEDYLNDDKYFGAIIGRYANRIEGASFELNGVEYRLYKNEGDNHLHGGLKGFDKKTWRAEVMDGATGQGLSLKYVSVDGEEGYPGNLDVTVNYILTDENALIIDYLAVSDKDTVVNLTNHSYFNLSGHNRGDILEHRIMINSDSFTAADENSITTGEIVDVKGTPMDFTQLTPISAGIDSQYPQIVYGKGYDHNWVLKVSGKAPEKAAELYDPRSGRVMELYTTKPGLQFYSGNFLDGSRICKDGARYAKRSGLCLETQYFPNSIKHKHFPSPILKAGQQYKHSTIYKFSTR